MIIKSITTREMFRQHPEVKKFLWGEELWTDGHFVHTVSKFDDEATVADYVKE